MSLLGVPEASFVLFHVSALVSVPTFKEKEFCFQHLLRLFFNVT